MRVGRYIYFALVLVLRHSFETCSIDVYCEGPYKMVLLLFSSSGFTLVCEKDENRVVAENILDLVIRHLQEYCQVILQPSEVCLLSFIHSATVQP